MEEMERDIVVFTDDEGNEIELDVIDYFEHEGQEYAVLTDLGAEAEAEEDDADCEQDVYIFKLVVNEEDETEEFLPADEELMDTLTAIVEERLSEGCECECGCGCEEGEACEGCNK
ncbi:MAG: DUF1292 domain-containing protein [Clostridia bacterium]|nr:DUF1292 domain-containing protein [Candidatus Pelethousia sp.]NCB30154.1 DUF1292 domain-containing protein [Clostridia bacterium]